MKPNVSFFVVVTIGAFMFLSFISGVLMLVLKVNISEGTLTALIITPISTCMGALVGILMPSNHPPQTPPSE